MQHTPNSRSDKPEMPSLEIAAVHRIAVTCGFSDAGVVALPHSQEALDAARFNEWVKAGRSASMRYLERQADDGALLRARVQTPFPWARSIIVCFASYQADKRRSLDPAPDGSAWIARYAWSSQTGPAGQRRPSDYHKVLLKRLHVVDDRAYRGTAPERLVRPRGEQSHDSGDRAAPHGRRIPRDATPRGAKRGSPRVLRIAVRRSKPAIAGGDARTDPQ